MNTSKCIYSHNIIYRNLDRNDFISKILLSFERKNISFTRLGEFNQLVYVNIIEGKNNSNGKPVEQYAIRDSSGKMILNNLLIFEIYIPSLLKMIQRNNELFLPDELLIEAYEIQNFNSKSNEPVVDETIKFRKDLCISNNKKDSKI